MVNVIGNLLAARGGDHMGVGIQTMSVVALEADAVGAMSMVGMEEMVEGTMGVADVGDIKHSSINSDNNLLQHPHLSSNHYRHTVILLQRTTRLGSL
jgi:hypothetical protein